MRPKPHSSVRHELILLGRIWGRRKLCLWWLNFFRGLVTRFVVLIVSDRLALVQLSFQLLGNREWVDHDAENKWDERGERRRRKRGWYCGGLFQHAMQIIQYCWKRILWRRYSIQYGQGTFYNHTIPTGEKEYPTVKYKMISKSEFSSVEYVYFKRKIKNQDFLLSDVRLKLSRWWDEFEWLPCYPACSPVVARSR